MCEMKMSKKGAISRGTVKKKVTEKCCFLVGGLFCAMMVGGL